MIFLIVVYMAIMLVCVLALARNSTVLNERLRIIDRISELNQLEIAAGKEYDGWRYRAFSNVTYDEMMRRFWVPVKSFYQNHPCLEIRK